ncbi:MAG TPA: NADH-quinone oxidoreductase subunit K [Candidatus Sulfotelmatobacter sp.]|nr:NADH-quinone oxidoreductase subunit K [Candidatus Sulfotelmatobacter sp.]
MTEQLLNLLGALLLLAAFRTISARHLDGFVSSFVQQSVVLAGVALVVGAATDTPDLYVVAILTLVVKAWAVPLILRRVAADLPADEGIRSLVGIPFSIVLAIGLVVLAFLASPNVAVSGTLLNEPPLSISVSMVLMGLFVVSTRRHAVAQLVGLLTIENGLFSGAIAIAYGLPLIVEFGIMFDILIAVVVVGLLVSLIHRETATIDTTELRHLRG